MAQPVKNLPAMQEMEPWVGKSEKEMATQSSILPRESCGQRSLEGYSQ